MKAFLTSGESVAGIPVSRKLGLIAVTIALVAMTSPQAVLAARRHRAAVAAAPAEEESAASASNSALGPYSEACVLEPTTGTVIFEANDHTPWPTASLAKMMLMLIVAEKIHDGSRSSSPTPSPPRTKRPRWVVRKSISRKAKRFLSTT